MPARRLRLPCYSVIANALSASVFLCAEYSLAQPVPHHPGRWSPGTNWGSTAIHLNLLRGDSTHSQILFWQGHHPDESQNPGFHGGLWGWNPVETGCGSYPAQAFVDLTATITGDPDSNIFCAGHTPLADGRLLVTGGTLRNSPENGGKFNRIFNPALRRWESAPDMAYGRWYPTATLLGSGGSGGSGRVLVSSGSQYRHMDVFGGKKQSGGLSSDSLYRFGFVEGGKWDPPVVDPQDPEPAPREGHTLVAPSGWLFGGKDAAGSFLGDLWVLHRSVGPLQAADYEYDWDPLSADPIEQQPAERAEHAALMLTDGTMVIYGGRRTIAGQEQVFSDVWRVTGLSPSTCRWEQVTVTTTPPPPPASHGALRPRNGDDRPRDDLGGLDAPDGGWRERVWREPNRSQAVAAEVHQLCHGSVGNGPGDEPHAPGAALGSLAGARAGERP